VSGRDWWYVQGADRAEKREERRIPRPLRRPYACALTMARSRQQREPFCTCLFVLSRSPRATSLFPLYTLLHASTALAPAVIGVAEGTLEKRFDRTTTPGPYVVTTMYVSPVARHV
jgi:hypothetical protein